MQGRLLSFISENSPPKSVAKNWLFGNLPRKNRHFMIIGSALLLRARRLLGACLLLEVVVNLDGT